MKLQVPTLEDCQQVRIWRNECLETLRTPYPLTKEQQEEFYKNIICNRNSPNRYWSIVAATEKYKNDLIGFGGLTFIEWENRQSEISLIIEPDLHSKGYGEKAVELILDQAFNYLNLELVYGECYLVPNGSQEFWKKITEKYGGRHNYIRKSKYWNGQHYDSLYFDITKDEFNRHKETI